MFGKHRNSDDISVATLTHHILRGSEVLNLSQLRTSAGECGWLHETRCARYMSQVTCRFPQACRVENPQMAARQVVISVHTLRIGPVASTARETFRAEVGTIYTLVATSHL